MNESLTALYELQQVDSALDLARRQYHALDPGRAEQAAAETAREMYERLKRTHHDTHAELKDAELELESVERKRKDFETKLYSGKVQNPKELQSIQDEIEALGRQRGRLDEKILTLMDLVEMRRAEEAEAQRKLQEAEAALATKQAQYRAAAGALSRQVRALTPRREQIASGIPAALLNRYESIRKAKGGVGIGRITDGVCGACHTVLPLNLVRRVLETDAVEVCENCGRLLCAP